MSDWTYVGVAFTIVWGSLAVYAIVLARRVSQARTVARSLRESLDSRNRQLEQDHAVCDAPPAP